MSDLLSIGASSVRAYQTALTTTSENIANAGDTAYVRRTAVMKEVASLGGKGANFNGLGSAVAAIARNSNAYTETSLRGAASDLSRTEAGSVWLERIESALDGGKVGTQLTAFFAAGTALASDPTSTARRASMLSAAGAAADSFAVTARALDAASTELGSRVTQATGELNRLNQALVKVNQGLGRTAAGTAASAQLADQRDQILEQMSALTDVNVSLDPAGRATVRAGGPTGAMLVDSQEAGEVVATLGANGELAMYVQRSGGVASMAPTGGALAGMADGAQRIAGTRDELEAVAREFTDAVNRVQQAGDDANGAAGQPMFAVSAGDPTSFSVAITDPAGIAAAARGGGSRDATNLTGRTGANPVEGLAGARTASNVEARTQALVTSNAATLKQRQMVADAQTAIHEGAVTAKSEVSGVNLDQEAVDLVRFQQAYQASTRVIQVAREVFQSMLQIG